MTGQSPTDDLSVLIVGTGLIGTSIALALRESDVTVWLHDNNPEMLTLAVRRGAGEALPEGSVPDIVVVAVPPRAVADVVAHYLRLFPKATITDSASVKAAPLARLRDLVGSAPRFVGGHPMAGREVSGPNGARADLFEDRLWVITAAEDADPDAVADVRWLARTCGSLIVDLDPQVHDRAVALTSHTPQILASVLAAQLADADPNDVAVSGQGLRDTTRLADSAADLWAEIIDSNAPEIVAVLDRLADDLDIVRAVLAERSLHDHDSATSLEPIRNVIERGNAGRAVLPDKHGGTAHVYESIPVVVADKPGELGRLFAAAGQAGVNLEDVRIEHTVGRLRAIIDLLVTPDHAVRLRQVLAEGGWQIRG